KAAAGITRSATTNALADPRDESASRGGRSKGRPSRGTITALLRKKNSPALILSRFPEGKERRRSRIGVDVGEYFAICRVSAVSSIGEFLSPAALLETMIC